MRPLCSYLGGAKETLKLRKQKLKINEHNYFGPYALDSQYFYQTNVYYVLYPTRYVDKSRKFLIPKLTKTNFNVVPKTEKGNIFTKEMSREHGFF